MLQLNLPLILLLYTSLSQGTIVRQPIITRFNPTRRTVSSNYTTPIQIGNGNFAFGADITGLQTLQPFNTLSSWGWHNTSLPNNTTPANFTGLDWWTHGRLVNYDQPNPAEPEISQWLIANPHRVNLGRVGFAFFEGDVAINVLMERDVSSAMQELDLYSGSVRSVFTVNGSEVEVTTVVDPHTDTLAVKTSSMLLNEGRLGFFVDYPYATDVNKFEAPYVGDWDAVNKHKTDLENENGNGAHGAAKITHQMDNTVYYTYLRWNEKSRMRPVTGTHRYILQPQTHNNSVGNEVFELTVTFSPSASSPLNASVDTIQSTAAHWWKDYWETGAFIDLTATQNATAIELQRRIILSQYLLAVNEAGGDPPQESGLVNNGWYGKFHMEMYLWHSVHWLTWGKSHLLERSIDVYNRFLQSAIQRAANQGYDGARWGKMTDPTGRSAPGEINSLLIWQQPHVFYFAETEYQHQRPSQREAVLLKWDHILTESADFMASFAFWNESTQVYDLGPPMYPASENTPPNSTTNPTFELAYWRFGLDTAITWKQRLNETVPETWNTVAAHLAPLPTTKSPTGEETYTLYEGISNMWRDPQTVMDHPALTAIYGLLPAPSCAPDILNRTILTATAVEVARAWNFTDCWGWDFPMLAMNSVRLGDVDAAVRYLVDEYFQFDDVGMPIGSEGKAPTPYFPGSGGLLQAVAMMAGGWGEEDKEFVPAFPRDWMARVDNFERVL
ncbi:Six-hairpin glycosidase-like protein [Paecilomyces variotii]|uniref:Six-hairpin glycosidase-like protein n=1 Tax=Byssochlamys spectabilis TaxID=264951 RepID=A0A443HJU0_BYSSP|nr:Six-hairpin glycosidase-like protein [Paecilomyces variotii]KAJ9205261.1 hypothetical protein DTO032I3_2464 [Paecilomyces variotii]KAJ9280226.1 hypothetical protein DTO021D3_2814 [Paecilomyces variotii]KAJ9343040.1 hypothetical protein DTO027B6_4315 [Paecilomyces variotii]KAJ9359758.1 hypothetical protein DTO027B9_1806 [Paecilomyces variotii]KAJ9361268.1 hypothetical protein DTO280E4_4015 [Paecilomyces variotii]